MDPADNGMHHRNRVAAVNEGAWRAAARAAFSPGNRTLLIALVGLLALVFLFVGSNVAANHEPKPHDLPVGIVGPPGAVAAIRSQLDRSAPGAFAISVYRSSAAARTAILHRSIYGAFDPGRPAVLLVASAASRPAAALLQQTFQDAARAQRQRLVIRDLVPLSSSDSAGATAFSAIISLVIGGILGSSIIYLVTQRRALTMRLAALIVFAIGTGVLTALVTNVIVGAFSGHFLAIWGVATLFVLAMALPIAAFQVLLGLPGAAVGLLAFSVIGTPSSGGSTAPQLLPSPWRTVSQVLPPGAGVTAMRDVVYFHGYGATHALLTLGAYAVVGAVAAITLSWLRTPPAAAGTKPRLTTQDGLEAEVQARKV